MKMISIIALIFFTNSAYGNVSLLLSDWEQRLREHQEDGLIRGKDVSPIVIVSVKEGDHTAPSRRINQTIGTASRIFGRSLMICEQCLNPEVKPTSDLYYRYGQITLQDVRDIYTDIKPKPRSALWVGYDGNMLSYRIVSISSGQVIYGENIQENMDWNSRSVKNFSKSRMQERLAKGDAISHHHWDLAAYPGFHFGYNFLNQWGEKNDVLSGVAVSIINPNLAVGYAAYKVIDVDYHPIIGGQVLVKIPEAAGLALAAETGPSSILAAQFIAKNPFPGNMGGLMGLFVVNTEGTIALGVSW